MCCGESTCLFDIYPNTLTQPNLFSRPKMTKEIEKIYQKVSQLEHVLLRPDTYVGSVEYSEETVSHLFI